MIELTPVRNNQVATVAAALNYKVSADILCSQKPEETTWRNIVDIRNDPYAEGLIGNRMFTIHVSPLNGELEISVADPNLIHNRKLFQQPCTFGEWNTYSVEVRRMESNQSKLKYVVSIDGVLAAEGNYDAIDAYSAGDLLAFASNDIIAPASNTAVKNFFYQTFEDCNFDPCAGLEDCQTIINGCAAAPVRKRV